jgi:hypothetical protein
MERNKFVLILTVAILFMLSTLLLGADTRRVSNTGDVDLVTSVNDSGGLVLTNGVLSGPQTKVGQFVMSLGKEIELDFDTNPTQTIGNDTGGIHVLGLPDLFKIGSTATGSTVTAANLDTLTDTSDAGSLHTHLIEPQVVDAAPVQPYTCAVGQRGRLIYVDDNNDTAEAYLCFCGVDADDATYIWLKVEAPAVNCF